MYNPYIIMFSVLAGILITVLAVLGLKKIVFVAQPLKRQLQSIIDPMNELRFSLSDSVAQLDKQEEIKDSLWIGGGALAGVLFALMLGWGQDLFVKLLIVSVGAGSGAVYFIRKNLAKTKNMRTIVEISIAHDAIVFYTKANKSIYESLQYATMLTKIIKPALKKCVAAYPDNSKKAIQNLGKDLKVPQGEVLASILIYMLDAGPQMAQAALIEESKHIESLRTTLAYQTIMTKPLWNMIYRYLPLLAMAVLLIGPAISYLSEMFKSMLGG